MKRFFAILAISLTVGANSAMAWSKFGHEVIIELAKRHISEKTKANIAKVTFSALGNIYGWGGSLNSDDCSGYMRNVYNTR